MTNGKTSERLYQDVARSLVEELAAGRFPLGTRLPAERELALRFDVSRPTVREAMIALEVQGFVEVRLGSGAYVLRLPNEGDRPGFDVSAFELTEARLLFEGEAAALAATQITDEELTEVARLVDDIAQENNDPAGTERADREFHLAIARATRNSAIYNAIEQLWDLRQTSPEAALLHSKARTANVKPVVEEHCAVLDALRSRDANAARAAMRAHLAAVLDGLLFATEEQALAQARRATQAKRERYTRATA
ncbi:FadR/GntR family transcriptional regulator [Novosphingobium sp. B-7]|uniref:FadR/GntR family transcriptional regulator n=1 Tax=Novosphingobium sp. B-7 TaxID=1298855 RepID=UPI0003B6E383|nr:FadR/GntR family transcriptional regulator [Novosphingobium sp. B-7]